MIELILFTIILSLPIYLIYLLTLKLLKKRMSWDLSRCFIEFVFCCYFVNLLNLTGMFELRLSNWTESHAYPNLLPLINNIKEILCYGPYVLKQILLNILLFIPFGFLMALLKTATRKIISSAFLISMLIEVLQYFNGRFTDIDDVISNVLGTFIGYLIYIRFLKLQTSLIIKKAATR